MEHGAGRKCVSHDSIVNLRVYPALVQSDTRASGAATLRGFTEALDDVSFSRTVLVLQDHYESAGMRSVAAVIRTRPGVNVNQATWRHHEMPGVADIVGKHGGTKANR